MNAEVPVLITWDIDPNPVFSPSQKREALRAALTLCNELRIAATFHFVAKEAIYYPEEIAELIRDGHEVGCHGLTHGDEEEYELMAEEMQHDYIEQATRLLQEHTGTPITAFRGPRVKVSSIALAALAEHGYVTDSSVCSQRMDIVSSNLIHTGWLRAPRLPYHPHQASAFKRGDLAIWEVPVSALLLPFISTSLFIFRLPMMKALFRLLYTEAKLTGKPIVYLAHPEEFGPQSWAPFKLSDLSLRNLRTHGLMLRKQLNESRPESRLSLSRGLFSYIASFPKVRFVTMRQYVLEYQ
jgi:peptidoglycan/xylan/chitin deacetylase (PgdA/CDA1 family)